MSERWEYEEEAAEEAFHGRLYNELGPQWAEDHAFGPYEDHYKEAIKEFTAERLKSYYVAHPNLAEAALNSLMYADSLMASHPKGALVFACP